MKKVLSILLIIVLGISMFSLVACDKIKDVADGAGDVILDRVPVNVTITKRGFATSIDGEVDNLTDLQVYKKYYYIFEFEYSPEKDNDGMQMLVANIKIYNVNVFTWQFEEAEGETSDVPFDNEEVEGEKGVKAQVTVNVGQDAGEVRKGKMIISLEAKPDKNITKDELESLRGKFGVEFESHSNSKIRVTGDGANVFEKNYAIVYQQLGTPTITWNKNDTTLTIASVTNADKYYLVIEGIPYSIDGELFYINAVEGSINVAINLYKETGYKWMFSGQEQVQLQVVAVSNTPVLFRESEKSNVVDLSK